ncbi:MAG: hypothetical protein K2Q13_04085 [Nitrosomonas sp.]|uniref:hypothetical protein n=1 Tax=Nitrosomonas sp. TaxID=42353 RepID=UPI0025D7E07B|nr:hypothetical protein [Nitrosomonas sp.]MBY0474227.1 hypothetical protein [Nitrosomonas sp.]
MNPFSQSYVKLPTSIAAQPLKWHPGHGIWMAPGMWSSNQSRDQLFNIDIPAIVAAGAPAPHIQLEIQWNDLETAPGVYNWAVIDNKAAIAIAAGCKVIIKIICRTYGGFSPSVPAYMTSAAGTDYAGTTGEDILNGGTGESQNGEYKGANLTNAQGVITGKQFQAKLWVKSVADKYRDMLIAVGQRYDPDPNFVGIIINETSQLAGVGTGMTTVDPKTSVPLVDAFFRRWLNAIIEAKPYFSTTPLTWMTNFPAAGILSIFDQAEFNPTVQSEMLKYGIGGHEQDFYRRSGIVGQTLNTSYDAFDAMVGITPRVTNMSNGGSLFSSNGDKQNPTPPGTASQLAQEARARGVNIILWHVVATVSGTGGATWRDRILPLLLANRTSERPMDTFPSFYL